MGMGDRLKEKALEPLPPSRNDGKGDSPTNEGKSGKAKPIENRECAHSRWIDPNGVEGMACKEV